MRLGIFGTEKDPQVQAVAAAIKGRGCEVALVDTTSISRGIEHTFDGQRFIVGGQDLTDVGAWYMRHIIVPVAPAYQSDDGHRLFRDWYVGYMHQREHSGFQLSWLQVLAFRGVPVVNPPEHGGVFQLKTFQLAAARELGLAVPRTLVTNNAARVRAFRSEVKDVVFKPSMGGGLCEPLDGALDRLDELGKSPVIFQERVRGVSVRATFVGGALVSCVKIPSSELDYRADPDYSGGKTVYEETTLPDELIAKTQALLVACGLLFAGVDFIFTPDGRHVFLEANSSPIYLDVERKTGAPISDALARLLLDLAHQPSLLSHADQAARRTQSFVSFVRYASPYDPKRSLDDGGRKPPPLKPAVANGAPAKQAKSAPTKSAPTKRAKSGAKRAPAR